MVCLFLGKPRFLNRILYFYPFMLLFVISKHLGLILWNKIRNLSHLSSQFAEIIYSNFSHILKSTIQSFWPTNNLAISPWLGHASYSVSNTLKKLLLWSNFTVAPLFNLNVWISPLHKCYITSVTFNLRSSYSDLHSLHYNWVLKLELVHIPQLSNQRHLTITN